MVTNVKKIETKSEKMISYIGRTGMILMIGAAFCSLMNLTNKAGFKSILPRQTAMAVVPTSYQSSNPINREREDVDQHYISYAEVQRTPARSGRS